MHASVHVGGIPELYVRIRSLLGRGPCDTEGRRRETEASKKEERMVLAAAAAAG